jgi:hypothetical protein
MDEQREAQSNRSSGQSRDGEGESSSDERALIRNTANGAIHPHTLLMEKQRTFTFITKVYRYVFNVLFFNF